MDPRELPFPVQVTFHGAERRAPVEEAVRGHVAHLSRFHPRIHGVSVTLTRVGSQHKHGNRFRVQVRVAIPGNDVVVGRHHAGRAQHEDPLVTVSDAFRAVERRLEDDTRVRRGAVKARAEGLQRARVARVAEDASHGFLETADGREVYFHRNSVVSGGFDGLGAGTWVHFAEEEGLKGPQASTVHVE